jgi:putative nucleotidyltransferase with HDIG domain
MATASKAIGKVQDWHAQDVPPFPTIALKALNLMAGTDTSLFQLCNLVRPDAAFSAEVIRIANSPLVAFPKNVTNILQASMVLGFRRLRGVIITVGLRSYLAGKFTPMLHSCWRHCVATGMIAERIATAHFRDKDFAYTAGILHDIGRIAMAVGSPDLYEQVRIRGADQPRELLQTERALYGIDHCHAGATLAKSWHLPDAFLKIITHHHDIEAQAGDEVASIVAVSCLLAETLGFGIVRYRRPLDYTDILNSVANHLHGLPSNGEEFASELAHEIQLVESA